MRLIHKHWHGMGSSPPQCNTPTGEGVGGDDFDGEDDDGEQDRADRTPPEEPSGTDAEGTQAGEQSDVEVPQVSMCIYLSCSTSFDDLQSSSLMGQVMKFLQCCHEHCWNFRNK